MFDSWGRALKFAIISALHCRVFNLFAPYIPFCLNAIGTLKAYFFFSMFENCDLSVVFIYPWYFVKVFDIDTHGLKYSEFGVQYQHKSNGAKTFCSLVPLRQFAGLSGCFTSILWRFLRLCFPLWSVNEAYSPLFLYLRHFSQNERKLDSWRVCVRRFKGWNSFWDALVPRQMKIFHFKLAWLKG